jgi:NAD(P)H-dependent flavin oxidoreductase YrpB (nitropropane dioxygenase family)
MADVTRLAAAVSNAGALGMVTLTWSADVGAVVRETASLTSRPFGGNLVLTEDRHHRLDQALEAGLRIVSFMWGDPSEYVRPVHDAGGIVMLTVGSAEEARRGVASGVDVIVAQGWEAGGHVWSTDVIAHFASGEDIVRYEPAPPMTGTTGEIEALSMWAGQGVALARRSQPAADIVAELSSRL